MAEQLSVAAVRRVGKHCRALDEPCVIDHSVLIVNTA